MVGKKPFRPYHVPNGVRSVLHCIILGWHGCEKPMSTLPCAQLGFGHMEKKLKLNAWCIGWSIGNAWNDSIWMKFSPQFFLQNKLKFFTKAQSTNIHLICSSTASILLHLKVLPTLQVLGCFDFDFICLDFI
jgi:hypothetical protein